MPIPLPISSASCDRNRHASCPYRHAPSTSIDRDVAALAQLLVHMLVLMPTMRMNNEYTTAQCPPSTWSMRSRKMA
jgi:hypothetical protein